MGSSNSPCAACKLQRRKCTQGCIFAPYFPPDQPLKFSDVHRVFGASNVSKILNDINPAQREDAVNSLAYEAEARLKDPVYGCVGYIFLLQHRLREMQEDLLNAKKELANYIGPAAFSSFIPQSVLGAALMNHHHRHREGMLQLGNQEEMGTGLGLMPPGGLPQPHMLLREQQQMLEMQHRRQMFETQQMAAAAAARKQQLSIHEQHQQQQELVRLNRQQDNEFYKLNCWDGSGGSNQIFGDCTDIPVAIALPAPPQPPGLPMARMQQSEDLFHAQRQRNGSDEGRRGISLMDIKALNLGTKD